MGGGIIICVSNCDISAASLNLQTECAEAVKTWTPRTTVGAEAE